MLLGLALIASSDTLAGSVSVKVMPSALQGPKLLTVSR